MKHNSTESLFQRFRGQHDQAALAEVYNRVHPQLIELAKRLRPNAGWDVHEDLAQDTFVVAILKAERWDASKAFLPWICGILINLLREQQRQDFREPDLHRLHQSEVLTPTEIALAEELQSEVQRAVDELPEELAAPLREIYFEHKSARDVSRKFGLPATTLNSRMGKAMHKLRRKVVYLHAVVLGWFGLRTAPFARAQQTLTRYADLRQRTSPAPPKTSAATIPLSPAVALGSLAAVAIIAVGWLAYMGPNEERITMESPPQPTIDQGLQGNEELNVGTLSQARKPAPIAANARAAPEDLAKTEPTASHANTSLSGWVRGVTGEPVPLALIKVWKGPTLQGEPLQRVKAKADGQFLITNLPSSFTITAEAPGWVPMRGLNGDAVFAKHYADQVLLVARPTPLEGQVLLPDGTPAQGAQVTVVPPLRNPTELWFPTLDSHIMGFTAVQGSALTDFNGHFLLADLGSTLCQIRATLPPYAPLTLLLQPSTGAVEMRLHEPRVLSGQVLNGSPAMGCQAQVREWHHTYFKHTEGPWIQTSPSGQFELFAQSEPQPPQTFAFSLLMAKAPGFAIQCLKIGHGVPRPHDLQIALEPEKLIAGILRDSQGNPVPDRVLFVAGDRFCAPDEVNKGPTWEALAGLNETRTRPDGTFEFHGLYAGLFTIWAKPTKGDYGTRQYEVVSGSGPVELTLEPARAPTLLSVRLVNYDTRVPIQQARFSIHVGGEDTFSTMLIAEDERFHISVPHETFEFHVQADGYLRNRSGVRKWNPGLHSTEMVLTPARQVGVRVVDAEGNPVTEGEIELFDRADKMVWLRRARTYDSSLSLDTRARVHPVLGPITHLHNLPLEELRIVVTTATMSGQAQVDLRTQSLDEVRVTLLPNPE